MTSFSCPSRYTPSSLGNSRGFPPCEAPAILVNLICIYTCLRQAYLFPLLPFSTFNLSQSIFVDIDPSYIPFRLHAQRDSSTFHGIAVMVNMTSNNVLPFSAAAFAGHTAQMASQAIPHTCPRPECGGVFTSAADLYQHQYGKSHWRCVKCDINYYDGHSLKLHNAEVRDDFSDLDHH